MSRTIVLCSSHPDSFLRAMVFFLTVTSQRWRGRHVSNDIDLRTYLWVIYVNVTIEGFVSRRGLIISPSIIKNNYHFVNFQSHYLVSFQEVF